VQREAYVDIDVHHGDGLFYPYEEDPDLIYAVIHQDGTSRVQIVRPEIDPFAHAYLKAMGRRVGVEESVNTSLNVAGPIVQTPVQALQTLKRSQGMDGILFIGADGEAFLAWHDVDAPPKDPQRLRGWLQGWRQDTEVAIAGLAPPASLRGRRPTEAARHRPGNAPGALGARGRRGPELATLSTQGRRRHHAGEHAPGEILGRANAAGAGTGRRVRAL
jgi:hypothetical protein